MNSAVILAAGKGTRMKSSMAKTMHKVLEKPMIEHIVDNVRKSGISQVISVVGYGKEEIEAYLKEKSLYVVQEPLLGTGHAIMQAESILKNEKGYTVVINGDCPVIQAETYQRFIEEAKGSAMAVLTAKLQDPKSYGRIIRDEFGDIIRIVEYKDATEDERQIQEINTGIYVFNNELLFSNLSKLKNKNNQNEYYITDLVDIFVSQHLKVSAILIEDPQEAMGVNDRNELVIANKWLQNKINTYWLNNGVTFIDPTTTYIGVDVEIGEDTIIYPNTYISGNTKIGKFNTILSNCTISNSTIGDYNNIDQCRITDSVIKNSVKLGPWAHLRNNCVVEDLNRIGNFVEFKNTTFGYDSRCAHLTYLGDCEVGSKVNMGCGVVTVNYDGKNKHKTVVKDGAFIGSNVNLIAPITVGEDAVVAAGSTITRDVLDGDMAIERSQQVVKTGYGIKYKNK